MLLRFFGDTHEIKNLQSFLSRDKDGWRKEGWGKSWGIDLAYLEWVIECDGRIDLTYSITAKISFAKQAVKTMSEEFPELEIDLYANDAPDKRTSPVKGDGVLLGQQEESRISPRRSLWNSR